MVECSTQRERVREIYGVLNGILWQMERSAHYNYIPGTEEDGWDYFEGELSKAEAAVQRSFLGETEVRRRLERIVKEVRYFVKRYETPGVCDRWLEIDPALKYFDVVFDALEDHPEMFLEVERGVEQAPPGAFIPHFAFQPTARDVLERRAYFEAVQAENEALNNQFSEERIFQNELVRALELVMLHDFPELFGPEAAGQYKRKRLSEEDRHNAENIGGKNSGY